MGVQVHSAATVRCGDEASAQAAVDSGGRVTTMLVLPAPVVILAPLVVALTDAHGDADASSPANGTLSGRLVVALKMPATHETSEAALTLDGSGTAGVLASLSVSAGSAWDGTRTAGMAATVASAQDAVSAATLTLIGTPSAALRPTPS